MRADLALIGFGHVGRRFASLLEEQRTVLLGNFDLETRIVAIATRRHGCAYDADGLDAAAAADMVASGDAIAPLSAERAPVDAFDAIARLSESDSAIPVAVETTTLDIVSGEPAVAHVRTALAARCHVITANKGPAAFAYRSLRAAARNAGVSFLFEGAVMDGVPVFNLVRETMPAVRITGFRGIINSTTNHILSALEDGQAFAPALARMQKAGIAEADPSLDVDGWDAAAKAAALANVLLDAEVTPRDVERSGLTEESAAAAVSARAHGNRLRLVAACRAGNRPTVGLVELPASDLLASLRGTANALVLQTDLLGDVAVCQLEGSLTQTAYALLSDLVTIRRASSAQPEARARQTL